MQENKLTNAKQKLSKKTNKKGAIKTKRKNFKRKRGCRSENGGAKAIAYRTKGCGTRGQCKRKRVHSFFFLQPCETPTTTSSFKKLENSNSHQISQTSIPFCLIFRADHETILRFHRGGLCKEKSKQQLRIEKNENTKNNELSKIK